MRINPLLRTDSYKQTHWRQYPKGTQRVYSYMESRGGMFNSTLMFGLQYYLKEYLSGQVFTMADIEHADARINKHIGPKQFNTLGWKSLLEKHGGRLPLRIRAIPEGHVVNGHNALITVENTDPEFFWLTNWAETMLLKVWYPITVATLSREIKQIIGASLVKTGDPALLPFKLHDFGYRGVSSEESAAIGGAAHLINFQGTDTLPALELASLIYDADMAGFSIPATEHSTITSWGQSEAAETNAYNNVLEQYPTGLVACVSDSFDLRNAVEKIWGDTLRNKVISRQGTLVIRPDSGDPMTTVKMTLDGLWERFSGETNSKGYKVLAPCVRVIQGDGVNYHSINQIVRGITDAGYSMDNLAFGMGGALLQSINRDTEKFAFKASAIQIDNKWHPVYKDPKTDPGKRSKSGRFAVTNASGEFNTIATTDEQWEPGNVLETVFEDGEVTKTYTFDKIRHRASLYDTFVKHSERPDASPNYGR